MVRIYENFKSFRPPEVARKTIEKLLGSLPERYLTGLQSVVLTDSTNVRTGKTNRIAGKKFLLKDCRGFYHRKRRDEPAWIEIVVDNIVEAVPAKAIKIGFVRELVFADVVFHEVGHHLDATLGSLSQSPELSAREWSRRLARAYFRRHYWYLSPFLKLLTVFLRRKRKAADSGREQS